MPYAIAALLGFAGGIFAYHFGAQPLLHLEAGLHEKLDAIIKVLKP